MLVLVSPAVATISRALAVFLHKSVVVAMPPTAKVRVARVAMYAVTIVAAVTIPHATMVTSQMDVPEA